MNFSDRYAIGVPQVPQKNRMVPGEEAKVTGGAQDHSQCPSLIPKNEAKPDPVARLQLSQWQWLCHKGAPSTRNPTAPHRHLPLKFLAMPGTPSEKRKKP